MKEQKNMVLGKNGDERTDEHGLGQKWEQTVEQTWCGAKTGMDKPTNMELGKNGEEQADEFIYIWKVLL